MHENAIDPLTWALLMAMPIGRGLRKQQRAATRRRPPAHLRSPADCIALLKAQKRRAMRGAKRYRDQERCSAGQIYAA